MHHPTPLQLVVAALPDAALRPLLLELLGASPSAPSASADATAPADAASTTTPTPRAKHPGGRPPGSRNKAKAPAAETGAKKAAKLAAHPDRTRLIAAVAAGTMTQTAAAKALNCTPKTISGWIRRKQQEPAASSAADQTTTAASRPPVPVGETPEQRSARLARHAARQRERDAERRRLRDAERAALAAQPSRPSHSN